MLPKIIAYIEKYQPVSYETLEERAIARGMSLDELDALLARVHKDKRISTATTTVLGKQTIVYTFAKPKVAATNLFGEWSKANYPWPGQDGIPSFVMPWPDWNLSYLFMKPEEAEAYRATMRGNAWQHQKAKYKKKSLTT